jgi:hypothetical protein
MTTIESLHEELAAVDADIKLVQRKKSDLESRREELLQAIADQELALAEADSGIAGVLRWWEARHRKKTWVYSRKSVRAWLRTMAPPLGWPDGQLKDGTFKIQLSVRAADSREQVDQDIAALNRIGDAVRAERARRPDFHGLTVDVVSADGPLTFDPVKSAVVELRLTSGGWTLTTPAPCRAQIASSAQDCAALVAQARQMALGA